MAQNKCVTEVQQNKTKQTKLFTVLHGISATMSPHIGRSPLCFTHHFSSEAVKEILLAGDTNRLVAELTFVTRLRPYLECGHPPRLPVPRMT